MSLPSSRCFLSPPNCVESAVQGKERPLYRRYRSRLHRWSSRTGWGRRPRGPVRHCTGRRSTRPQQCRSSCRVHGGPRAGWVQCALRRFASGAAKFSSARCHLQNLGSDPNSPVQAPVRIVPVGQACRALCASLSIVDIVAACRLVWGIDVACRRLCPATAPAAIPHGLPCSCLQSAHAYLCNTPSASHRQRLGR